VILTRGISRRGRKDQGETGVLTGVAKAALRSARVDAPAEPDDGEVPAAGPADFAAYDALTVLTPRQRAAIVDAYAKVFQPRPSDAERLALIVNPSGLESVITGLRKYASSAALDTVRVRVKENDVRRPDSRVGRVRDSVHPAPGVCGRARCGGRRRLRRRPLEADARELLRRDEGSGQGDGRRARLLPRGRAGEEVAANLYTRSASAITSTSAGPSCANARWNAPSSSAALVTRSPWAPQSCA